ncbi:MAG: coproporphyrinogen-III oxidase family protein [Planctomycetota bacterium]
MPANDGEPGLRCRIQKEVGQRWIVDLARRKQLAPWVVSKSETAEQARQIAKSLFGLPQQIDVESIVRQWQLAGHYRAVDDRRQPPPPWSPEGFEDAGESAWRQLSTQLTQTETTAALSCYVHLPFCDRKCGFCDCYSVFIPPGNNDRQEHYFQALIQEIELWSQFTNLGARPLTTVHLGGGTPTYLPAELLERLIDSLKNCFGHTPSTEWALESTTSQLSPENLQHLKTLGFTRLHIGVQSLDQRIRKIIGRQEPTEQVLQKIVLALDYGFVVTSDLIFGLPGQKQESFIHDIQQLIDLGIDGCSLYHLNESLRNQTFLNQVSGSFESPFQNYLSFHIGEQLLRVHGYEKTHFAHFSRPRDRNLYYRHVVRNEDLLALGTTADGSFGDYSYRHPPLAEYQNLLQQRQMPLQGGLRESVTAIVTRPLSASLMAGYATLTTFQNLNADSLRIRWLDYGLIEESNVKDRYVLTANGSWYLSHLLTELHCHAMEQGLQPSSTS